jgi:hypothetical protein
MSTGASAPAPGDGRDGLPSSPVMALRPAPRARRPVDRAVALVVAALAGCTTTPDVVVQQIDTGVFCASIGWFPQADTAGPPATIVDQRIRTEILRALDAAGRDTGAAAPACWVRHFAVARVPEAPSTGVSVGIGGGGGSGGWSVSGIGIGFTLPIASYARGKVALTIDLVDAARRQQVWSGTLEDALPLTPTDEDIARAVAAILAKMPPGSAR